MLLYEDILMNSGTGSARTAVAQEIVEAIAEDNKSRKKRNKEAPAKDFLRGSSQWNINVPTSPPDRGSRGRDRRHRLGNEHVGVDHERGCSSCRDSRRAIDELCRGPVAVGHGQDEVTKAAERHFVQRLREDVAEVLVAGKPFEDDVSSLRHRAQFVKAGANVAGSHKSSSGKNRLDCRAVVHGQ